MKITIDINNLENLLEWNMSQNHTKIWGCIKGQYSRTYSFMHYDKIEVIKWILENHDKK